MSFTDHVISALDDGLRTLFARPIAARPNPATETPELTPEQQRLSGALMRVNHVGEVCAQALYTAQALAARSQNANEPLAQHMLQASREETDHLAWTLERLEQLHDHPSRLNPLWYAGAFTIGMVAGKISPSISLGFVAETERQVQAHLQNHLDRLPLNDTASRSIVKQMMHDEGEHATQAIAAGGQSLPWLVPHAMRLAAKCMTTIAHRI